MGCVKFFTCTFIKALLLVNTEILNILLDSCNKNSFISFSMVLFSLGGACQRFDVDLQVTLCLD